MFTGEYLNSLLGTTIILIILSLITEKLVELIRYFAKIPDKFNRLQLFKNINAPSFVGKKTNENKKRELSILTVLVGILIALISRASLFDLIATDNASQKLFWQDGLIIDDRIFRFSVGIIFTGFLLSLGSRFFHDLSGTLYYAKKNRKRLLNTQSYPKKIHSDDFQFLETDSLELAKRALTLHEKELRKKYSGLIEYIEIGNTVNNRTGIIAYLKNLPPVDFPRTVPVKLDNGSTRHIEIEFILVERGKAQFGIGCRLQSADNIGVTGALGGIIVFSEEFDSTLLLTCSHTALAGSSDNLGGYAEGADFGKDIQILKLGQKIAVGKLIYAKLDEKSDTAIVKLENNIERHWDNELPDGNALGQVISVFDLRLDSKVMFYSSLKKEFIEGTIHNRCSQNRIHLEYEDSSVKSFRDLIVVGNNFGGYWSTISEKGDSGSILFDEEYRPFGLIIGGGNQFTYAVPLKNILEETNTQIYLPEF